MSRISKIEENNFSDLVKEYYQKGMSIDEMFSHIKKTTGLTIGRSSYQRYIKKLQENKVKNVEKYHL